MRCVLVSFQTRQEERSRKICFWINCNKTHSLVEFIISTNCQNILFYNPRRSGVGGGEILRINDFIIIGIIWTDTCSSAVLQSKPEQALDT